MKGSLLDLLGWWLFSLSVVSDSFANPCTVACQAPLSMGFSRQEYWSELLFPSPGDLLVPGIKPMSPALAGGFLTPEPPGKKALCLGGSKLLWRRDLGAYFLHLKSVPAYSVLWENLLFLNKISK